MLFTCTGANQTPDFGKFSICETLKLLPAGHIARKTEEENCVDSSPLAKCTFTMAGDKANISYYVENAKITTKTFQFSGNARAPFGLYKSDSPRTAQKKLKRITGTKMELFDDADGTYVQSADIPCAAGSYSVYVFYAKNRTISDIIVSTLPAF